MSAIPEPTIWQTKFGPRRVRRDPPTLEEALIAAQGLTDTHEHQIAIAAELMGASLDEARAELKKLQPERGTRTVIAGTHNGARAVVVERKVSRRMIAKPATSMVSRRSS